LGGAPLRVLLLPLRLLLLLLKLLFEKRGLRGDCILLRFGLLRELLISGVTKFSIARITQRLKR
jgi:hypothetical protein